MSKLTKIGITKIISNENNLTIEECKRFLDRFLGIIKTKSVDHVVKLNNFGSFYKTTTPKRIGRNPKTKESYIIHKREKIRFSSSSKIRQSIN